jgi:hypothetical protein
MGMSFRLLILLVVLQVSPSQFAELRSRVRQKLDRLAAELVEEVSADTLWALGEQFAVAGRVRAAAALMEDALNRMDMGAGTGAGTADLVSMRVKTGNYLRLTGCTSRSLRQYRYRS